MEKYDLDIMQRLKDYGVEAEPISENEKSKIKVWLDSVMKYKKQNAKIVKETVIRNNDPFRSWLYAGVFGKAVYSQGLSDFKTDCAEYDKIYIISATDFHQAEIRIKIANALKFCENIIYFHDSSEYRLKVPELSGCFFWNAKKERTLYYELDMGTQTWYF